MGKSWSKQILCPEQGFGSSLEFSLVQTGFWSWAKQKLRKILGVVGLLDSSLVQKQFSFPIKDLGQLPCAGAKQKLPSRQGRSDEGTSSFSWAATDGTGALTFSGTISS